MCDWRPCQVCSTRGELTWSERLGKWICSICIMQRVG
jgi:hypothetical protein